MYYAKMFDYLNCEYQELRTEYENVLQARMHARLMSKRKGVCFAIVEDDEFNRYGWFEKGYDIGY